MNFGVVLFKTTSSKNLRILEADAEEGLENDKLEP